MYLIGVIACKLLSELVNIKIVFPFKSGAVSCLTSHKDAP